MSIGVVVGVSVSFASVPAAQATVACTHATLFATPGGNTLKKYNIDGTSAGADVSLATAYFDIAFDSTNGTFYGINANGQLDIVNIATGAVIRSVNASAGFYNSLSVLPTGMVAASQNDKIVYINPRTGATTDYFDMNDIVDDGGHTYSGWSAAGDFITMADGSLIALLSNGNVPVTTSGTIVVRIANGAGTVLGTVPPSWGGARVQDKVFVAGADGELRRITSLPLVAGHGAIATTTIASADGFYGAAGTEDSDASTCSTTGRNGYTPGVDEYATTDPGTPSVAGALVSSETTPNQSDPSLSNTGVAGGTLASIAGVLGLAGAALLALGLRRRRAK